MSAPENAVVRSYAEDNRKLAAAFARYLVARGLSSNTSRNYRESLQRFLEFLGSRSLLDADRVAIREFLGRFLSRGLSQGTINRHTDGLRAFYKFARFAGVSDYDPTFLLARRKLPYRLPRVLSPDEVERLIGAAQTPLERAIVEVLYATGVRVSELVNFRLDDIQWAREKLQPSSIRLHKGKGGKDRVALFGSKAAEAIRAYQKFRPSKAGFLFEAPARDGGFVPIPQRPYTARAIRVVLTALGRRAGLGRVHPHMLRRACASHLLQDGADLRVVQELLGHASVATTEIYTHLGDGALRRAFEGAHPRARRLDPSQG